MIRNLLEYCRSAAFLSIGSYYAFALLLLASSNDCGIGRPFQNAAFVATLAALLLLGLRHVRLGAARGVALLALVIGAALFLRAEANAARSIGALLTIFGLTELLRGAAPLAMRSLALGAAMSFVTAHFLQAAPLAFAVTTDFALAWSAATGDLVGIPRVLGPTAVGLAPLLTAIVVLTLRFALFERRVVRLLACSGLLLVAHQACLTVLSLDGHFADASEGLALAPWIFSGIDCLVVGSAMAAREQDLRAPAGRALPTWTLAGFGAALLIAPGMLPLSFCPERPRAVFFGASNPGLLDWNVPEVGRYGPYSQGMFGLMLDYLQADGFELEIREGGVDPSIDLDGVDLLVAVNADRQWHEQELQQIWSYVHDGGSVLVLGDHTDVGGTRVCANDLLAPVGIEFNYDSALCPPSQGWEGGVLAPHPLASMADSCGAYGAAVGASLKVDPWRAQPLITSRFGFSDLGNQANREGAYLGDYKYLPGERAGDVVIAAYGSFGAGCMIAFGDTSGFQNASLGHTWDPLLRDTFRWAAGEKVGDLGGWRQVAAVAGIALIAVALVLGGGAPMPFLMIALLLLLAPTAGGAIARSSLKSKEFRVPSVLFDTGHWPRIDHRDGAPNQVRGAIADLYRHGLFVRKGQPLSSANLERSDVYLTIAPVETYSRDEVEMLEAFVERGGLAIVCTGFEHHDSVRDLLDRFDMKISSRAIGSIPFHKSSDRLQLAPEFVHAWPCVDAAGAVITRGPDTSVYAQFDGLPIVAARWRGRGGLVLISDSYFFNSENYASLGHNCEPNLRMLQRILLDHRKRSKHS